MTNEKIAKKNLLFSFIMLFIAFIVTVLIILTGAFLQGKYSVNVGSVAPKRYKAPRRVVNEIATQRLREEAAESVDNLYSKDTRINEKIISDLDTFFEEIDQLRAEYIPIVNPYDEENFDFNDDIFENAVNNNVVEDDLIEYDLKIDLENKMIEYLIQMTSSDYNEFKTKIYNITIKNLEQKITDDNSLAKALVATKGEFDSLQLGNNEKLIGYEIISTVLVPNSFIDEELTKEAIEKKVSEVEPVVFVEGQTIINEGEIIQEDIYEVLVSVGYVSRGFVDNIIPILGCIITIFILFSIVCLYIYFYNKDIVESRKKVLLVFTLFISTVIAIRLMSHFPYHFAPVLLFTMLISMLCGTRISIIMNFCMTVICAIIFNGEFELVMYFGITGIFCAVISKYMKKRSNAFLIGIGVSLVGALTVLSIGFFYHKNISDELIQNVIYAILNGLLTVILCTGTLPFWESVFGVITTAKLNELTNPNNKLLRRLIIEAPGTYHHSLIVANLAETAAYDIGANAILARVGAYYHDIGKLKYPQYFAENQAGENLHESLDPYTSYNIITSHLSDGLEMARESKLPKAIEDIITQHHGNTLVKYFYYKAVKESEPDTVNEADFRYKFETPKFKEAGIVMLADTVEAAVRSMIPTGKSMHEVEKFIKTLMKDKLDDGQLTDSMLSIKDLEIIKESFMKVFKGMYHERIPYPNTTKEKSKDKKDEGDSVPKVICEDLAGEKETTEGDSILTITHKESAEENLTEKKEIIEGDSRSTVIHTDLAKKNPTEKKGTGKKIRKRKL